MSSRNLATKLRVSVGDTESKHDTTWNDDYGLYLHPDIRPTVHRTFEKPNTGPRTTLFRGEQVPLNDVPTRVADVFAVYADAQAIGLPTSGGTAPELEREEAVVTVMAEDDDTDETTRYYFTIYSRQYGRVKIDGDRARLSDIPQDVIDAADQYVPDGTDFLDHTW